MARPLHNAYGRHDITAPLIEASTIERLKPGKVLRRNYFLSAYRRLKICFQIFSYFAKSRYSFSPNP
jgi:hypothetical protein